MSDKNKELLLSCLCVLTAIFSFINHNRNTILFALMCVSLAGVLIIGIPLIIKQIKNKKAAKRNDSK